MNARFSCSVCSKCFDNKRSQIRHSSYCRKREKNPPKSRKRACLHCTRAKAHCDTGNPSCERCIKRKVTCVYQQLRGSKLQEGPLEQEQEKEQLETRISSSERSPSIELGFTLPDLEYHVDQMFHDEAVVPLFQTTPEELDALSWTNILPAQVDISERALSSYSENVNDLNGFSYQPLYGSGIQSVVPSTMRESSGSELVSPKLISKVPPAAKTTCLPSNIDPSNFSMVGVPFPLYVEPVLRAPRAFVPKKMRYRQLSLSRKFIICTLAAYPYMMLPDNGLPPFIHSQSLIKEFDQEKRISQTSYPGPLAACAGIIAMWSVKNKNNSVFIWRAIKAEQERILTDHYAYSDQDAVAAWQSICLYFILRVHEKDSGVTDFDIPLIGTMIKLSIKIRGITEKHSKPSINGLPTWEGWALAESLRRTIYIIFIIDFLFDLDVGTNLYRACDVGKSLSEMPLPCSKGLWSAQTRSKWEIAYMMQSAWKSQKTRHALTFFDLLRHDAEDDLPDCDSALDLWLAGVDEFGAIIVASAGLADDGITCSSS